MCPLLSQVVPRPEIGCKGPSQDAVLCGQAEVSGNIYEKQEKISSAGGGKATESNSDRFKARKDQDCAAK